ncbi:MAG: hypothetical protein WD992_01025 [Candidatus Levyibacteriota bacterium]
MEKFIPNYSQREHKEAQVNGERYRMVRAGGRIKSAGLSTDYLYRLADPFIGDPNNPDALFEVSKRFSNFKDKPPFPFRVAFFPQDEAAMRAAFKGLGIYRPTIKTDQGPAGNVGYFFIDEDIGQSQLEVNITLEEGVALPEAYVQKQFYPSERDDLFKNIVAEVQQHYRKGEYEETYAGILNLRELGKKEGIGTTRRAVVGRGEFFFFRPVQTEPQVSIGKDLIEAISKRVEQVMLDIGRLAEATKYFFSQGLSLREAIERAREAKDTFDSINSDVLYFQPDILIRKDGSFDIEKINMPDLGMFMTEVQPFSPNETLGILKDINGKIKEEVLDIIAGAVAKDVLVVTRSEVLTDDQDTLERLEIKTIQKGLVERGKAVTVSSLDNVLDMPNGSSILLLNVPTDNQNYENLLFRVARGELKCYPDPFIKLLEKEATTFPRKSIKGQILTKFLQIIAPSALDKKEGVFAKYQAIQKALRLGGVDLDIVYFSVNEIIVPTFRYDVKSFSEVQKAVENERRRGKQVDSITAIPTPFKPEDALIYGADGPRLAVFRFMFVRK